LTAFGKGNAKELYLTRISPFKRPCRILPSFFIDHQVDPFGVRMNPSRKGGCLFSSGAESKSGTESTIPAGAGRGIVRPPARAGTDGAALEGMTAIRHATDPFLHSDAAVVD
jgi:hypothetical protein